MSSSKKKSKNTQHTPLFTECGDDNRIKLKNLFGIKPIVYLPLFYALLLLIFLIFWIYSSLVVKNGQIVKITSIPTHAAVLVDGTYLGSTPLRARISKGEQKIEVSLPYFGMYSDTINIKNPLLKLVRRKNLKVILRPENLDLALASNLYYDDFNSDNIIKNTISEIASWNIANNNNHRFTIPDVLESRLSELFELLNYIKSSKNKEISKEEIPKILNTMYYMLYYSLPYLSNTNDYTILSDEEKIWLLNYNKLEINSLDVLDREQQIVYYFDKNIKTALDKFSHALISAGDKNSKAYNYSLTQLYKNYQANKFENSTLNILDFSFSLVKEQNLKYSEHILDEAETTDPIHRYLENQNNSTNPDDIQQLSVKTPRFYILDREINQLDFNKFLDSKNIDLDEWKRQHQDNVSPSHRHQYFLDFSPDSTPLKPLRFITWYDAQEYITWLNLQLSNTAYRAKLPNEFEWQAAVMQYPNESILDEDNDYFQNSEYVSNSINLYGSLWEWGDSWYSPNPQYAQYQGPVYGSEKHIFGGSYFTKRDDMIMDTPLYKSRNTSAPPNWANEYIGFRIILVSK